MTFGDYLAIARFLRRLGEGCGAYVIALRNGPHTGADPGLSTVSFESSLGSTGSWATVEGGGLDLVMGVANASLEQPINVPTAAFHALMQELVRIGIAIDSTGMEPEVGRLGGPVFLAILGMDSCGVLRVQLFFVDTGHLATLMSPSHPDRAVSVVDGVPLFAVMEAVAKARQYLS